MGATVTVAVASRDLERVGERDLICICMIGRSEMNSSNFKLFKNLNLNFPDRARRAAEAAVRARGLCDQSVTVSVTDSDDV